MSGYFKPCWSCGAQYRECYPECECAKCVDPQGYEEWRHERPDEYREWIESQQEYDPSDDY